VLSLLPTLNREEPDHMTIKTGLDTFVTDFLRFFVPKTSAGSGGRKICEHGCIEKEWPLRSTSR
jgi:hypothetical protein